MASGPEQPEDRPCDTEATFAGESDDLARRDSLHDGAPVSSLPGYQLRDRLGKGAFGEVWSAFQERTGQVVAVKIFHRAGRDLAPLRREVERLGQVARHPNVVSLLDADLDHDPPYLVTPLLSSSLEGPAGSPAEDVAEVARWFEQVASALQYIHGKGMLHCDLKPANVLLDEERAARVSDFGQAHLLAQEGASLGTLWYMAPEQAAAALGEGGLPDVSWDVYALGATVYHLLTGQHPRSSPEAREAVSAQPDSRRRLEAYRAIAAGRPLTSVRALTGVSTATWRRSSSTAWPPPPRPATAPWGRSRRTCAGGLDCCHWRPGGRPRVTFWGGSSGATGGPWGSPQ